jgi:hypothetical protein
MFPDAVFSVEGTRLTVTISGRVFHLELQEPTSSGKIRAVIPPSLLALAADVFGRAAATRCERCSAVKKRNYL